MTGTYCYLATNPKRIKQTIAGLNLDMVGEEQELCQSSFLIEEPPLAIPSYTSELLARIREFLVPEVKTHSQMGGYALFRYAVSQFSGGSDHYILSDPRVGIPCPMLIQWPDIYYHTSLDTLEKVCPKSLKRVGVISATYAYFLATAQKAEAIWLSYELASQFKNRVIKLVQDAITDGTPKMILHTKQKLAILLEQKTEALTSIKKLGNIQFSQEDLRIEMEEVVENETSRIEKIYPKISQSTPKDRWEAIAEKIVPKRRFPGPIMLRTFMPKLSKEDREKVYQFRNQYKSQLNVLTPLAEYWADGKRNLLVIIDLVEIETGIRAAELIVEYFRILEKLKLVRLIKKER